jgi:hypothetical protein
LTSLFGTRRRLPISATAHACGHQTRALTILAGTDAVTPFLFLRVTPLPCGSGDPRRAAQRPLVSTPVPVPPGSHQVFPTAISTRARHLRELPRRSFSGDRRARVRGPREGRVDCRGARCVKLLASGAWASKSQCGRRSLPRRPLDIRCRRCVRQKGRSPASDMTDRPRSTFRRLPAKDAVFPRTGMPSTVATARPSAPIAR